MHKPLVAAKPATSALDTMLVKDVVRTLAEGFQTARSLRTLDAATGAIATAVRCALATQVTPRHNEETLTVAQMLKLLTVYRETSSFRKMDETCTERRVVPWVVSSAAKTLLGETATISPRQMSPGIVDLALDQPIRIRMAELYMKRLEPAETEDAASNFNLAFKTLETIIGTLFFSYGDKPKTVKELQSRAQECIARQRPIVGAAAGLCITWLATEPNLMEQVRPPKRPARAYYDNDPYSSSRFRF